MDWIHCNKCFVQLEPGRTLHLTSCGHIICDKCLNDGATGSTCLVCRVKCSVMPLNPGMSSDIEDYFMEPDDLIRKSCDVIQFQRQHRRRLHSYLLQTTKKFHAVRAELRRVTEICQKQHKRLTDYQKIIQTYESQANNRNINTKLSPFNMPISPNIESHTSPMNLSQTPIIRPAKSTPYNECKSTLLTPTRITKHRSPNFVFNQTYISSKRISSTVLSPESPQSAGSQESHIRVSTSGYTSNIAMSVYPAVIQYSGHKTKLCLERRNVTITKMYI